jgi:predicted permease
MLARATSRSREVAVRAAIGAGRWQLIRQTVVESAVLSAAGAVLGLALAYVGMRLMLAVAPAGSVVGLQPRVDVAVLLFTLGIGVASALLFALVPAWQVTRVDPLDHLKAAGRIAGGSRRRQRLRSGLVVAETALAMVLLVGAGLLIRSLGQVQGVTPGFEPRGLVIGGVALPERGYQKPELRVAFYRALVDRLRAMPGVAAAAAGSALPFTGGDSTASFEIEGQALAPGEPGPHGRARIVSPGYFSTLGIPMRKGRVFTDDDRLGTDRVVVIDKNLAATYWPGQDPIGKRIRGGSSAPWVTIVGVVGHVLHTSLAGESDKGTYYLCVYQLPLPGTWIVARMRPGAAASASVISEAIGGIDPTLPVQSAGTMVERMDESLGPRRFVVWLLGFFAAVALLMAALGLYGVVSYSVAQRTQEIGVRMALGADARSVVGLVLRQGATLALSGVAIGAAGSVALSRLLASQLYNVSPFDPLTFVGMVAVLMLTAFAASFIPAYAASRIDPLRALRYE